MPHYRTTSRFFLALLLIVPAGLLQADAAESQPFLIVLTRIATKTAATTQPSAATEPAVKGIAVAATPNVPFKIQFQTGSQIWSFSGLLQTPQKNVYRGRILLNMTTDNENSDSGENGTLTIQTSFTIQEGQKLPIAGDENQRWNLQIQPNTP